MKLTDELLRTVCRPDFTVNREIIDEMFKFMYAKGGVGLAANQVGIDARLFITEWGEVFINPVVIEQNDYEYVEEGCLSLPRTYRCRRANRVLMSDGKVYTGCKAHVIQHELDHLNGKLIIDT